MISYVDLCGITQRLDFAISATKIGVKLGEAIRQAYAEYLARGGDPDPDTEEAVVFHMLLKQQLMDTCRVLLLETLAQEQTFWSEE